MLFTLILANTTCQWHYSLQKNAIHQGNDQLSIINPYEPPKARVDDVAEPATPSPQNLTYAGFWRRFGASWLDAAVFLPLFGLTYWLSNQSRLFHFYYLVPALAISLLFHVWLVQKFGGTPGKMMLKIRIARCDGSAVGYREAIYRHGVQFVFQALGMIAVACAAYAMSDAEYFSLSYNQRELKLAEAAPDWYQIVKIFSVAWMSSEFFVMLTNKKRRALHDFMAGTVVVRRA